MCFKGGDLAVKRHRVKTVGMEKVSDNDARLKFRGTRCTYKRGCGVRKLDEQPRCGRYCGRTAEAFAIAMTQ